MTEHDHDHSDDTVAHVMGISSDDEVLNLIRSGKVDNILDTLASPYYRSRSDDPNFCSKIIIEALVPALEDPKSDLPMLHVATMVLTTFPVNPDVAKALCPVLIKLANAAEDGIAADCFRSTAHRVAEKSYPGGRPGLEAALTEG